MPYLGICWWPELPREGIPLVELLALWSDFCDLLVSDLMAMFFLRLSFLAGNESRCRFSCEVLLWSWVRLVRIASMLLDLLVPGPLEVG